jgi:N-acetylglucosamine-6-phosphate deacetylase
MNKQDLKNFIKSVVRENLEKREYQELLKEVCGERLAGSALRMDRGIENLMRIAGLSLLEAVTMATRNPARVGRIPNRQRGVTPGERGDLVQFRLDPRNKSISVLKTWMSGRECYSEI